MIIEYTITIVILLIGLLLYFKIANKYNIIDKPNHRSAHKEITLRGGGIIYPLSFILFIIFQLINEKNIVTPFNYILFGTGLLISCSISFIDDLKGVSNKLRLVFHFISVTFLLFFINAFTLPLWIIPILYIIVIGIINAYNFMDGINGITGLYSISILLPLLYVNTYITRFTDNDFIVYPILASIIFLYFNFRKKAKCFMGDIGSIGIAFWIISLLGLLVIKTQDLKYILFLTIYGVDTILTILERLRLKENIFKAHKRHLYQIFANEKKISHKLISFIYSALQLVLNIFIIGTNQVILLLFIILIITFFYLTLKTKIKVDKK